jgi:hypothetical protein
MAAPDRIDRVPILDGPYLKVSNPPSRVHKDRRCLRRRVLESNTNRVPANIVLMVVVGFALGKRRLMRCTRDNSWMTGHRTGSLLRVCVCLSSMHPFFWFWKVIDTYRDWASAGSSCGTT